MSSLLLDGDTCSPWKCTFVCAPSWLSSVIAIVSPAFTTSVGPTKFSSYARPGDVGARDIDAAIARDEIELQHTVLGLHARRFGEGLTALCRSERHRARAPPVPLAEPLPSSSPPHVASTSEMTPTAARARTIAARSDRLRSITAPPARGAVSLPAARPRAIGRPA